MERTRNRIFLVLITSGAIAWPLAVAGSTCPIALSSGQPACVVSNDIGSSVPDSNTTSHVGNPIDVVSGNKYQHETDVQLAGSPLALHRHYNSSATSLNRGLGFGWQHTYQVHITAHGDGIRNIMQSDGRQIRFTQRNTVFVSEDERDGYIEQVESNRHHWHLPDGRSMEFFGSYLTRINTADGESLSLYYRNRRLHSVTDGSERSLVFEYSPGDIGLPTYRSDFNGTQPGHLVAVRLPDGSKIQYTYSPDQNLIQAIYPRGTRNGLKRQYRYDSDINRSLLTERQDAAGQPLGRWYYDDNERVSAFFSKPRLSFHGKELGEPNLELQYSGDVTTNTGKTVVTSSDGSYDEYHWRIDDRGNVNELKISQFDQLGSELQPPLSQTSFHDERLAARARFLKRFEGLSLRVTASDKLGYPTQLDYAQLSSSTTHTLKTVFDQRGTLVDVRWLSGEFNDVFDSGPIDRQSGVDQSGGFPTTSTSESELLKHIAERSQQDLIEGAVREMIKAHSGSLVEGTIIHGDELDSVLVFNPDEQGETEFRHRSRSGGAGLNPPDCYDPTQDCEELYRLSDLAELSECVYVEVNCESHYREASLSQLGIDLEHIVTGSFRAEIYRNPETDEHVVSFAGTRFTSPRDWWDNGRQEFGNASFQYNRAVELASLLVDNNPDIDFTFTGHSLGGGLATAAAAAVERQAIVFNPAGLNSDSADILSVPYENAQNNTTVYSLDGELLGAAQDRNVVTDPPGTVHELSRPSFEWIQNTIDTDRSVTYPIRLSFALHGISAVRQSVSEALDRYLCQPEANP